MKKVLCNVLYEVKIPVTHRELGDVPIDLGLFVDMEDAECAGLLSKKVLSNQEDFDFLAVEDADIHNAYIPESEMKTQAVSVRLHNDLTHFAVTDSFIKHFTDKYGMVALEMLVFDCMEELEDCEKESNPVQKEK